MKIAVIVSSLLAFGASGCTSTDRVHRGLFEGLQVREEIVSRSPGYGPSSRRPTYDEYERERKRLLNEGPSREKGL